MYTSSATFSSSGQDYHLSSLRERAWTTTGCRFRPERHDETETRLIHPNVRHGHQNEHRTDQRELHVRLKAYIQVVHAANECDVSKRREPKV